MSEINISRPFHSFFSPRILTLNIGENVLVCGEQRERAESAQQN